MSKQNERVVLDTNAIINALPIRSEFKIVMDSIFDESYDLCVSTEILLEYEEKLRQFFGDQLAQNFLNALDFLPNIQRTDVYFRMGMISKDLDDNKFVDCAFSANAHVLVSDDRHFKVLKKAIFPKINLLKLAEFKVYLVDWIKKA
jgi:uncharacterized protein